MLNKHSEKIIAAAKTNILFNKNPKEITIFLSQETLKGTMVKWVINSISADFLNIMKTDSSMIRFIPPSSHELDFANLKRAMEDENHLGDYADQDFVFNPLSVFFFLINNDIISINYVRETVFYIFDIPGYCITVKDFNRSGTNSGWLIENISESSLPPQQYLESLE